LEFSTHQKKRIKEVKNMQAKGLYDENVDDPFDLFVSSTEIRYTYYKESHKFIMPNNIDCRGRGDNYFIIKNDDKLKTVTYNYNGRSSEI